MSLYVPTRHLYLERFLLFWSFFLKKKRQQQVTFWNGSYVCNNTLGLLQLRFEI